MDRRTFFKRAGSATAAIAIVAAPLSLFAQKPKKAWEQEGKLIIEGDNVMLVRCHVEQGLELRARGAITVADSWIESSPGKPAIHVRANA